MNEMSNKLKLRVELKERSVADGAAVVSTYVATYANRYWS